MTRISHRDAQETASPQDSAAPVAGDSGGAPVVAEFREVDPASARGVTAPSTSSCGEALPTPELTHRAAQRNAHRNHAAPLRSQAGY